MSLKNIPLGKSAPEVVNAVIEIPKGSQNKYEYDEKLHVLKLDRVLFSPFFYPLDYGFLPETRSPDGDHLDIMVLGGDPVFPGCLVEARPVGLLKMIDSGEEDFKILGVQVENPRFDHIETLKDVETFYPHLLKEIVHFMETYKELQGKKVETHGWEGKEAAYAEIKKAQQSYTQE